MEGELAFLFSFPSSSTCSILVAHLADIPRYDGMVSLVFRVAGGVNFLDMGVPITKYGFAVASTNAGEFPLCANTPRIRSLSSSHRRSSMKVTSGPPETELSPSTSPPSFPLFSVSEQH